MSKENKAQVIDKLQEEFTKCSIGILTEHKKISTAEMNAIRKKMKDNKAQYRVVKNTLARLAAEKVGKDKLSPYFKGQTALILGYNPDVTASVKALTDHLAVSKVSVKIKAGFMGDTVFNGDEMLALSKLPTREVLLAKVVGGMMSPIYGLVYCLSAPLKGLAIVLQGRVKQLEETKAQ